MKMAGLALMVALLISHVPAHAQPAAEPGLETYRIGDLPLESGEVIRDFSIAYMTAGTLNAAKSNAVLMVTAIGGNHHRIDYLIGPGKGLDTDHLFVIRTNAIGNGLTTSPSTSTGDSDAAIRAQACPMAFTSPRMPLPTREGWPRSTSPRRPPRTRWR